MKIAFITPYNNGFGGMEVFTERLQSVLQPLGHSFEWFTFNESSRTPEHRRAQQFSFLPQRE